MRFENGYQNHILEWESLRRYVCDNLKVFSLRNLSIKYAHYKKNIY
jgi:hypothetical protein